LISPSFKKSARHSQHCPTVLSRSNKLSASSKNVNQTFLIRRN
jgi:hypothetical protein